ncbi:MAG: T9SS type A sorting domain-containing protein [Candidatus Neomarinimicrobiota bacterium]
MIKALVVLFSLSISFASDFSADEWKQLFEQFQKNYRTFSIDDLKKIHSTIQAGDYEASARDMEEFLGEWHREDETVEFYITVDADQSVPNMMALSGMQEAEGAITATGSDFEEQLTYILDPTTLDQGNDNYNWACDDGDGETQWYESEDECNMYCENDCYYDDEADEADDVTEGMVMNMNFFEFFTLLFGMVPENVDVPVVVAFQLDLDLVVQDVECMVFTDNGEVLELKADSVDLAAGAVFSDDENTITFNSLELKDSLRVTQLTVNGEIGPGTVDFEAGVPTLLPTFDPEMFEGEEMEDAYMVFNDDYTGMEIYVEEDNYSGELYSDTSQYAWWLDDDMVMISYLDEGEWLCEVSEGEQTYWNDEDECNENCNNVCFYEDYTDTLSLGYEFDEDTLHLGGDVYMCAEYDYIEDCIEDEELPVPPELRDISDLYASYLRVMVSTGSNVSTVNENILMPNQFRVYDAYPNPFNPVTTLRYQLPEANMVTVTIYDMAGREVKNLIDQQQGQGLHNIQWNGTNNLGKAVSAGIYLYQVQSGMYNQTNKMILLK